jgi:hypothetical protein
MTSYTISVPSFEEHNDVTTYKIVTETRVYDLLVATHVAHRRFSEFYQLYQLVQSLKIIPTSNLPRFPPKSLRKKDQNIIQQRKKAFDELCQVLALYIDVMSHLEVKYFLRIPPFDVTNNQTQLITDCSWDDGTISFLYGDLCIRQLKRILALGSSKRHILCHDLTDIFNKDTPLVVVKKLDCAKGNALPVLDVISQIRRLQHDNIVPIHDAFYHFKSEQVVFMLQPFFKHGNLRNLIKVCPSSRPIPESMVVDIFLQLISALMFLHEQPTPIILRNLSCYNIYITWMVDTGAIKVAIADMDVIYNKVPLDLKRIDRTHYWAPEIEKKWQFSVEADIWSLGVIMIELMTFHAGIIDHERGHHLMHLSKLVTGTKSESFCHRVLRQRMRAHSYGDDLIDLVLAMLRYDPHSRIQLAHIRHAAKDLIFSSVPVVRSIPSELFCYGRNAHGELGVGHNKPVPKPARHVAMLQQADIRKVVLGQGFTFFLTQQGLVYAVGKNDHGQLGLGEISPFIAIPTKVQALIDMDVVDIAAGSNCALALCSNGNVYGWGHNEGQLLLGHKESCLTPQGIRALDMYLIASILISGDQSNFFMILTRKLSCTRYNTLL